MGRLLVAVAVLLVFAAPAAADRTIVISGERSGYAVVDFPLPVLADSLEKTISVQGEGRLFGIVIRPDSDDTLQYPVATSMRSDPGVFCEFDCVGEPAPLLHTRFFEGLGDPRLETWDPGRYRVHLVVDELPVTASFKIPSLDSGVTALQPTVFTDASSQNPDMNAIPFGEYGGSNGTLHSGGLIWIADGANSQTPYAAAQWEECVYEAHQDADAFLPTCPGEDLMFGFRATSGPGQGSSLGWLVGLLPADDYALGGSVVLAGSLDPKISLRVAWIDFLPRDKAPPPDAPAPSSPVVSQQPAAASRLVIDRVGRVRHGRVRVRLRCEGAERCRGTLQRAKVSLAGGAARTVTIRVGRRTCRLTRRAGAARVSRPLPGRRCR